MQGSIPSPWKTNVLGVLGDGQALCVSLLCPALAYYAVSELFEENPATVAESCIGGYMLCCGFFLRTRLRRKYNLDGSMIGDFVAHLCCHCVAIARIWREAKVQLDVLQHSQQQLSTIPNPVSQQMMPPQVVQPPFMMPPIQNQQFMQGMPPGPFLDAYHQQAIYLPPQALRVQQQMQQGVQPIGDIQDTVDTNLSDFESRAGALGQRENTPQGYDRNDSMDPPPSVTDPDPWDMLPDRSELKKRQTEKKEIQPPEPAPLPPRYGVQQPVTSPIDQPGIPYEAYIAGEVASNSVQPTQPSAFSIPQVASIDSELKKDPLSARLAGLRPPNCGHRKDESEGSTSRLAKDTSAVADQIIMGGSQLVSILSLKTDGEVGIIPRGVHSHDDPPQQQLDKTSSLASKLDESSLMTLGATAGSEALPIISQELPKDTK